jgi:serine/threonine protein kinase
LFLVHDSQLIHDVENLLLDASGRILKITDFGVSEVFRTPFGGTAKKCRGLAGSGPYIAPEVNTFCECVDDYSYVSRNLIVESMILRWWMCGPWALSSKFILFCYKE